VSEPVAILLAEDEAMVRMIAAEILRDAGHIVWEAADGRAALEIISTRTDIKLLLSDVKMPHMDGYELLEKCLDVRPDLKAMFMSGYAQEPVPARLRHAVVAVLKKPFDIDDLPRHVDAAFPGKA
jgi:two-component system cell cycle response regulator CpdR